MIKRHQWRCFLSHLEMAETIGGVSGNDRQDTFCTTIVGMETILFLFFFSFSAFHAPITAPFYDKPAYTEGSLLFSSNVVGNVRDKTSLLPVRT
jgi:hypothetical protein